MNVPTCLLWLLAIVFTTSLSERIQNENQDGKYLILIPDMGFIEEDLNISTSIFNATEDTHITIQLKHQRNDSVIATLEDDIPSETTKMLKLPIPFLLRYGYKVVVNGSGGVEFSDSSVIFFNHRKSSQKNHEILIQTDKPIYKPLDHVKFRVFGIHADLRPSKSLMNITIKDPKSNIMQRWINEDPKKGVISHEYELSDKPVLGLWTIEMLQEAKKVSHRFQVKEYVLPTYKVTIKGEEIVPDLGYGFLFNDDKYIHVNVTAKYTFGKAVRGDLYLNATIDDRKDGLILTFHKKFEGESQIGFHMKDFKNMSLVKVSRYQNYCTPRKINFNAMVVEALTGKKMHAETFTTTFTKTPVKIHVDTPIIYKRGLPKKIKIQVSRVDGQHLTEHDRKFPLEIITSYGSSFSQRMEYIIPENGTIYFNWFYMTEKHDSTNIKIVYKGYHGPTLYEITEMAYPSEFRNEHKDNVEAILLQDRVNIGDDIKVLMNSTTPISWAVITVISNDRILSNKMMTVDSKTDFIVEIPTSEIMIPTASVVISCITTKKQLMLDASTAKITITFKNEVVGVFTKDEGQPGTNVDFKVKTMPGSAVFVMAVDKNLHLLESAKYISEDMVYDALLGRENSNVWRVNVRNIHDVLRSLRLNLLTNFIEKYVHRLYYHNVGRSGEIVMEDLVAIAPMGPIVPEAVAISSSPKPRIRKFFPETWIWQDGEAGESGEYTFSKSVPDSITMWQANAFAFHPENGLGIMKQPVEFLSHQDFFIHPELPYSLIRGESFILKVSIFSNLTQDQQVSVTLPESTEFTLNGSGNTQTVEVKAYGDNTVRFHVVPKAVGDIPIKIQANCDLASDEIHKNIIVKPEGYTLYFNKAFLMKVTDDTPVEIDYEFEPKKDFVEDSERVEVSVIGDIMGPTIDSLGHLIRIPSGCGEQNMINFAPNIYIHNYLKATSKLTPEQLKRIKIYTERGYKNQLQYQLRDGSFSAFGMNDKKGSTWLTAFVLRCFGQAKKSIPDFFIDDQILHEGINWLVHKKTKEHRFKEDGRVIHTAMQGGSGEGLALTIYVLISLFENQDVFPNVTKPLIANFVENLPTKVNDTYTLATMFYLMALIKDTNRFTEIEKLLEEKAITKDDMKYWETEDKTKVSNYYGSASTGIELAAYVLLAYTQNGEIEKGMPIMKWLMSQRNSLGGFHSTQDTVLGLEALSLFAAQVKSAESLTVTVSTDDGATSHTFPEIVPLTSTILHTKVLPSETKKIHISSVGKTSPDAAYTYALVQIAWQYNIKLGSADNIFEGKVEYKAISSAEMELDICHRMKEMNLTGMIIIEAALPSGYVLTNSKELLAIDNISKVEFKDSNVVLYLNKLYTNFSCYTLKAGKIYEIQGHLSPLPVKIRLYYKPDLELVTMYQLTGGSE